MPILHYNIQRLHRIVCATCEYFAIPGGADYKRHPDRILLGYILEITRKRDNDGSIRHPLDSTD